MTDYKKEIESLMATVIKEGASDLHLSVGHRPTIRVSGNLLPLVNVPELSATDTEGFAKTLLGPELLKDFLINKEMDFSYSSSGGVSGELGSRFRGNAFFQMGKMGIALRLIPSQIKSLEELRLPPILGDIARMKQGFFLVVGPVGQGKSTTLASMVQLINTDRAEHIVTIEDPIEYMYPEGQSIIDQREVRFDTQDFHIALKSMFRQDVNVGLIGEMRGPETISTAVTAAETGHLILSTLHTNSASQTIDRIIDSFTAAQQAQVRIQLAGSLIGIFSQRLVPRIAGGRTVVYELLLNNAAVSNLIREGRTHEINIVLETGAESGMINMNHTIAEAVRAGEITTDDAYRYTLNPDGLQRLL